MNNTQRKKIKMLYSFQEGYFKPPYPYSFKVRGYPSMERYFSKNLFGAYSRTKLQFLKFHAGCRICDGYGYVHAGLESEDCVCVTQYSGTYSKRAYRFWN